MEPVVLHIGDITLSIPTRDDVPAIVDACRDPLIAQFTTVPADYQPEHAEQFVSEMVPDTWAQGGCAFAIRQAGRLIGMTDIRRLTAQAGELGYWMHRDHRGRGILTRVVARLAEHAFADMGLHRLSWAAVVGNWGSWKPAWRNGFRLEGTRRAAMPDTRDPAAPARDIWVAGLLSTDPRRPQERWRGPDGHLPARPDARVPMDLVKQFHEVYGVPVRTTGADVDIANIGMRMSLIAEEFAELVGSVYGPRARRLVEDAYEFAVTTDDGTRDTVGAADALADLVYVAYGMALETGIPLTEVLAEVQASNLSKLGDDGNPIRRADGKILKGPGFTEPDIARVLAEHTLAPEW